MILAGVGGYLDTLGFLMLEGLFVNHVTGNIIVAAAHPGTRYLAEIVMLPVFFVMVMVGTLVAGRVDGRFPARGIPVALAVEVCLLALFMVLGLAWFAEPGAGGTTARVVVGSVGVGAMAVQTVVTRLAGHVFPTNMVTGTMTMLGMETAGLVASTDGPTEQTARRARAGQLARAVLGFAGGAIAAAALTARLDFWAGTVPVAVIALVVRRELRAPAEAAVAA